MQNNNGQPFTSEIFQASECGQYENNIMAFLQHNLQMLGYQATSVTKKIWKRGHQTVVVCLVDDFFSCQHSENASIFDWFDDNTIVITDNVCLSPVPYHIVNLPQSFYGIYSYTPANMNWAPTRRFNLAINRIDPRRLQIFFEIIKKYPDLDQRTWRDYVNVNCYMPGYNHTEQQNYQSQFLCLGQLEQKVYNSLYQDFYNHMPWRNHSDSLENTHVSAWCNVVIETYNSNDVISVSEKTFRALCTPSPWVLYAGRNTVNWLSSLGFDTVRDVVNPTYDVEFEDHKFPAHNRIIRFVEFCEGLAHDLKKIDQHYLKQRMLAAAQTNQQKLAQYRKAWPKDFASWWLSTVDIIA